MIGVHDESIAFRMFLTSDIDRRDMTLHVVVVEAFLHFTFRNRRHFVTLHNHLLLDV